MKFKMESLEDDLMGSERKFNPILREIYGSFSKELILLKTTDVLNDSVKIQDIIFRPKVENDSPLMTPMKDCHLSIMASVDGVSKEFKVETDSYNENSKLIDLIIGLNAFGEIDNYPKDFGDSMLKFAKLDSLIVPTSYSTKMVTPETIIYLEADLTSTHIYYNDGTYDKSKKNLGYFDENLPQDIFVRPHIKYIVNRDFIFVLNKKKTSFTLKNLPDAKGTQPIRKDSLPISRGYKQTFLKFLKNNFKGG